MTLNDALTRGEFVITCELVPGRGSGGPALDAVAQFARDVAAMPGAGIHAVSLTDNPGGSPAILPDALAAEALREGLDVLVHFSCRDSNRHAMEARAMALARAGIDNLLVVTGDYTENGYEGRAAPVFDLDAVQAIAYLKAMNRGLQVPGRKPGATATLPPTRFLVGAAVSPFKQTEAELMAQYMKMERKIAAGADFLITQLGYDMRKFLEVKRYLEARGLDVPLIGNVYVLSHGVGRAMAAGKVPGCVVSDELLRVLAGEARAEDKGKAARLERAARMLAVFKGLGFAGAHIGGFNLKAADFAGIVRRAAAIGDDWETCFGELRFSRPGEYFAFPERAPGRGGAAVDPDPVPALGTCRRPPAYGFALLVHKLLFEPRSPLYKAARWYFGSLREGSLCYRATHAFEWWVKRLIFGCRDCGDCALLDTAYVCPMNHCAKQLRNGACGGSVDGMCEVYPETKRCAWTLIYERLKSAGKLDALRSQYVPPRDAALEATSGWANYYLERDYRARARRKADGGRAG
jgi:methylenetetrahydrofolate reductase (NADPH)